MQAKSQLPMLAVLYVAAFISAFNENIVNVALYDIMGEFSVASTTAQWLVTGYMIVTSIIVAAMAFLSQRFTTRQLFFGASACFIAGEALSILAPSFGFLLVSRLLQSVGSGVFIPLMMGTVLQVAPRERMGTYLSIGSAAITLGPAFAPVASGVATTFFGWRSIFAAPLVVGALLALLAVKLVDNVGQTRPVALDAFSLVLAALGLTLFVYGLGELAARPVPALAEIAVSVAAIALFARRQGRIEHPLLNMAPLGDWRFSLACVLVIVAMMTTFSMSVLLPLYFEGSFGASALVAGALILPAIVVNAFTAIAGGRIMDRRGPWPLIPVGFVCVVAGQALIALSGASQALITVVVASVAVYAGVGLMMSPAQTAGLRVLPHNQHADGVSIVNTLVMVAASIGPSLFIGVMTSASDAAAALGASQAAACAWGFSRAVVVAAAIAAAGLVLAVAYSRKTRGVQLPVDGRPREKAAPTLARVMKRDAYTVGDAATVADAVRVFVANKTSGVPVVDDAGAVKGFISDGDIMRALSRPEAQSVDLGYYLAAFADDRAFGDQVAGLMQSPVMDYATRDVVCASAGDELDKVCALFNARHLKKLPVVEGDRLIGTVSRSDVVRFLMESWT